MSQSLLIQPKIMPTEQKLLSLNMRNVTDLFPGFTSGDFAAVYGSPVINSVIHSLCIQAQLPLKQGGLNGNVIFIDGANTFKANKIVRLAQQKRLNPKQAQKRICLFQASTAYEVTALIMERLQDIVEPHNAKLVVISDITKLFLDEAISEEEAIRVFSQVAAYLQSFARKNQIIVIATSPTNLNRHRSFQLRDVTCGKANVVLAFRQTMYDREFELEKHPQFMLGTAEFPSDNLTLTDFM